MTTESKETESILNQAGVYVNVARIKSVLNERGVNSRYAQELSEVESKLLELRKRGVERPVFTLTAPKKPLDSDSQEVKEKYALVRGEYDTRKQEYKQKLAEYERFSSPEYITANARFRLIRKLQKLTELLGMKTSESRTKQITSLRQKLETGLMRPTFAEVEKDGKKVKQINGHEVYVKFTTVAGVEKFPEDTQELKNIMGRLQVEGGEVNELFGRSHRISSERLKFSKDIYAVIALLVQEATADVLRFALRNTRKNKKKTLSVENLRNEVVNESNFAHLFFRLPAYNCLNEYMTRKEEYEAQTRELESKNKSLKGALKSFVDMEKHNGFMKVLKGGAKYWVGLNVSPTEKSSCFPVENVTKIFDHVKSETKNNNVRLSNRAKEYMCNLISQLLGRFVEAFSILRSNRRDVNPSREDEKSIRFESVIGLIRILLCVSTSVPENITKSIESMSSLSKRLRELKDRKK